MTQKNILTSSGGQQVLNEEKVDNISLILSYSIKDFLSWWYISMPIWHLKMLGRISTLLDDNLTISLLIKKFLVPWHRDYSFIGYVFGILIKLIYLPIAIITYLLICSLYLLIIPTWLALPPITLLFIFSSILSL